MPPNLALLLTLIFVGYLYRRNFRERPNVTRALWLPVIWALLVGSRSVAQWLSSLGLPVGGSVEEGNPIDAVVYFSLMAAGLFVLNKRRVTLTEVFRNNPWFVTFIIYCALSILWSDFHYIAFKRWIKALNHPIMTLVLLTEPDFDVALTTLIKRTAYILVPFSILLIKYFEYLGRHWDDFTGIASNVGVCTQKNGLGGGCMIFAFFFVWHFLKVWRTEKGIARRNELILTGFFLFLCAYLLRKAHSMTSILSLLIALGVMWALGRQWVNKKQILTYAVVGVVVLGSLELAFGIFEKIVDLTGHETTIAGRAQLWHDLLEFPVNRVLGTGFESFWLGSRLQEIWDTHWWHPIQAHNGYLETYLNLGLVGLFLLVGLLVSTFRKIRLELLYNFEWARFRLGFFVAFIFHNWTEASFRGLGLSWFMFHIIALEYGKLRSFSTEPEVEVVPAEEGPELAYSRE
jgi:exopolysaccharide production protein ExoQ